MGRFIAGDEASFEAIVSRYEDSLLGFFYHFTKDHQQAEDLTQETFVRVVRARASYEVRASFRTYLFRIARNLWIDRYRSLRSKPNPLSLNNKRRNADDTSLEDWLESGVEAPDARLDDEEIRGLLAGAITTLPLGQREVLVLWLETGMKYSEIAKVLDVPVGTIKSRMHTTVQKLREILRKHVGES